MSTTAVLIIGITVIWLAQRALTVRQALRFRRDLLALRTYGKLSVGMSRKVGRRVYAGLTFDDAPAADRVVTAARTLRGATVSPPPSRRTDWSAAGRSISPKAAPRRVCPRWWPPRPSSPPSSPSAASPPPSRRSRPRPRLRSRTVGNPSAPPDHRAPTHAGRPIGRPFFPSAPPIADGRCRPAMTHAHRAQPPRLGRPAPDSKGPSGP